MPPWPQFIAEHSQAAIAAAALALAGFSVLTLALRWGAGWRSIGRIGLFVALTAVLVSNGIEPYQPRPVAGGARELGVHLLEILWWCALAWTLVAFIRAVVIFERRPHESELSQQLLAGLIYLSVALGIIGNVFSIPIGALLATSGAVAIILGLALQSTLADVFSGIAINLGRSYSIGDWIVIDGGPEGRIIEANWQAIHLLTPSNDLAVIPNSVLAKAKLVNISSPNEAHGAKTMVLLQPTMPPSQVVELALEALASCNLILHAPIPTVTIKSFSASEVELELSYRIRDRSIASAAQNEVLDRVFRHATAAGLRFAPTPGGADIAASLRNGDDIAAPLSPRALVGRLPLFSSLSEQQKMALAEKMSSRTYAAGELVIEQGTISQTLTILRSGVLALYSVADGREHELMRLAPGEYFGEGGFLLGEPQLGAMRALTRVIVYDIKAEDLAPLLKERPTLAEELGRVLASRRAIAAADETKMASHDNPSAKRLSDRIRQLFKIS